VKIRLTLGQLLVEGGEPQRNLDRAERLVARAAKAGSDVIVLPETLDFGWTHPSALEEALPVPGPYSDALCRMARENSIYVCAGLTEKTPAGNFNTGLLINRNGGLICTHRKINLLAVELPFYRVGGALSVVDTDFGVLGLNVCADNYIDGLAIGHTLGRMGARVILSPSSWTTDFSLDEGQDPYADKWLGPFFILAKCYDLYVVSCTSVGYIVGGPYEGKKMIGRSLVVGPDGVRCSGPLNEFASDNVECEIDILPAPAVGTGIGQRLRELGYQLDDAQWPRFKARHFRN
jgi:predicted amidohydrolase